MEEVSFLGLAVGSWAEWFGAVGTISAIVISVMITKKQITAEKKKDKEHFFLEQDYLVMDKIQEKLLANKIFIESSRYTLEATLFQNTDEEIKKFWIGFIESYRTRYRTLIDNNNYVRNKIDEYAEINPLLKGIQLNELCNNNKIASYLSQQNSKMDGYLVSRTSKPDLIQVYNTPDKNKIIPILKEYSKSYDQLLKKIQEIKLELRNKH